MAYVGTSRDYTHNVLHSKGFKPWTAIKLNENMEIKELYYKFIYILMSLMLDFSPSPNLSCLAQEQQSSLQLQNSVLYGCAHTHLHQCI